MIDYQSLNNLPEITFKSKTRPGVTELAKYIDEMKADLFMTLGVRPLRSTSKHL